MSSTKAVPTNRVEQLTEQIIELCDELSRETIASNPNLWAETPRYEAVKRATTVAAVGRLPVLFIGPNADIAVMLAAQVGVVARAHPAVRVDDVHERARLRAVMKRFPIHCEAPLTSARYVGASATDISVIREIIDRARAVASKSRTMTQPANELWTRACSEIRISDKARRSIVGVAAACSALRAGTGIDVVDIAEAVNYWLDRE